MNDSKIQKALRPVPFEWTQTDIARFWEMVPHSPLRKFYFSHICGAEIVQLIQAHVPPRSHILDFGAGEGDLALLLLDAGYTLTAYEQSEEESAFLHDSMTIDHPHYVGIQSLAAYATFDCILLFEVLEHLHPAVFSETLQSILKRLAPTGKIIGTVPNNEQLDDALCICPRCASMFHRWQHMRSFTPEKIRSVFNSIGLSNIDIFPIDFAPSLAFIAQR